MSLSDLKQRRVTEHLSPRCNAVSVTEATIPGEELTSWLSELFQSYVQEGRKALMAITFLFLGILGDR